ncbi:MAG: pilus assembly protein [Methylobacterium mesophilicum]|nr:pilus assembly protein [Methylobacterium mesophilicum]
MMRLQSTFLRFRTDRSGTAAVEMAFVAPVFIVLLAAMIAYGIYLSASHSVEQIAADAARTAVAGLDGAERRALVADYAKRNGGNYGFLDTSRLTLVVEDSPDGAPQFEVQASYDARNLPIWSLFRFIPLPGTTIERRSTIRAGGA